VSALERLALTETEFKQYVWPELPISRPESNVPFDFAWGMLHQHSEGYLRETVTEFSGRQLSLKRVELAGASTSYGDVTVHRDSRLVVETTDGREQTIRLFGSMVEKDGGWKVFSYVTD
jgi:hypothetical protein